MLSEVQQQANSAAMVSVQLRSHLRAEQLRSESKEPQEAVLHKELWSH